MAKYEYETIDGTQGGFIPGFGEIKDGKISSDTPIESHNLRPVGGTQPQDAPISGVASQQNPEQPESLGDEAGSNDQPSDSERINLG